MKIAILFITVAIVFFGAGWLHCKAYTAHQLRQMDHKLRQEKERLAKAVANNK